MTGSFAGAVGYIDKQGNVQMRSKAEKITDANTKKQREVRTRFLAISTLAAGMKNVLLGLSPQAKSKRITLRNTFVKFNYKATEADVQSDGAIAETDFANVVISKGTVGSPSFGSPTSTEPLQIDVVVSDAFDDETVDMNNAYIYIVAYNPVANKSTYTKSTLDNKTVSLTVPNSWNGEEVHVYGFVQAFDSAAARNEYDSIFNDPDMQGGHAESTVFLAQANANYSESKYVGKVNIS